MSLFVTAYKKRTQTFTVTITDEDGDNVVLDAGDQVRIKIGRSGKTPIVDLVSPSANGNGTTVSRANPSTVRFGQADADLFKPGVYDIEAAIVDDDDNDAIKHADNGIFVMHRVPLGSVGLTN